MSTLIVIALAAHISGGSWTVGSAGDWETGARPVMAAPSGTTPAEASPFLGVWTSQVHGPGGLTTFIIEVRLAGDKVLATVNSDLMPEKPIEDITTSEQGITLRYTGDLWGYSVPVVVVLAPDRDQLHAAFSIMNGWFVFDGAATRKQNPSRSSVGLTHPVDQ
jgi:hypothetical protein